MRLLAAMLWMVASVIPTGAQTLVCFGNEPSWSISLNTPDRAVLSVPMGTPREFRGHETRNDVLREKVWRGRTSSSDGDLVLFLREAPCSDGMSDDMHPMFARASLPDGSFLAGCCRFADRPAATTSTLEGAPWQLVSLPGHLPATLDTLKQHASVQFDSGKVTGFNGCNTVTGSYTLSGNQLQLGPLAATQMACIEPASTVESTFNKMFTGTLSFVIMGNRLNLATSSGTVLGFEREAPTKLEGTWNVTGFNNGRDAVVSPIVGTQLTLSFENGTVSGRAGCNSFRGTYTEQGDRIKIGPVASTRMMCADNNVMTQERDFLKALESVERWKVQGGHLDMHRADDQRALEATQAAAPKLAGVWTVTGFNNGRDAVVSPIISTQLTLSFENGIVSGRAGCNTFSGTYTTEGNSIKFGAIAVTNMMCADNNVMTQERDFLKALASAVRWSVQGNELDMHRADDQRTLTAMSGQVK